MSKVLEASCVGGVVTADGVPVPGTTILSEGVAPSTGVLVLEEDKKAYIAKTSPDLKRTLDHLESALGTVAGTLTDTVTALTTVSAATIPPSTPAIAANLASLTAAAVQLNLVKGQVTALKGMLK